MKTINKYFLGVGLLMISVVGCKDKMIELNTNPDLAIDTDPRYLFAQATADFKRSSFWASESIFQNQTQAMQYHVHYSYGYGLGQYGNTGALQSGIFGNPNETDQPSTLQNNWGDYYGGDRKWGRYLNDLIVNIDAYNDPESSRYDPFAYQKWAELREIAMICQMSILWDLCEVNGAAVYTEAFQAATGILAPKYDLGQDIYPAIDQNIKAATAILSGTRGERVETDISGYDFFFGYKPDSYTAEKVSDYAKIRGLWVKYGNALRLNMAFALQHLDGGQKFRDIVTEIGPTGLMQGNDESAFYNFGYERMNGHDLARVFNYYATTAFVDQLTKTNDPRTPLLVRPNDLSPLISKDYEYMQKYFSDSLDYRTYNGVDVSWEGLLDENNLFVGMSANPQGVTGNIYPQRRITYPQVSWRITKSDHYAGSGPWKDGSGNTIIWGADTTISLRVACPAQGRYYIMSSGGNTYNWDNSGNGDDGEGSNEGSQRNDIKQRNPLITYPEQCFMMSYMAGDALLGGKTAGQWYELGVQAAMDQLKMDAKRYLIVIADPNGKIYHGSKANSETYPKLPTVNPTGPYEITQAMIDTYLAANPYTGKASLMAQVWVYLSTHAQNMQRWTLITGYPATLTSSNDLAYDQRGPLDTPWFEKVMMTATDEGLLSRRNVVPRPNAINEANYLEIRATLVSDPAFKAWETKSGRTWWDKKDREEVTTTRTITY